jgi:hypothetical protein
MYLPLPIKCERNANRGLNDFADVEINQLHATYQHTCIVRRLQQAFIGNHIVQVEMISQIDGDIQIVTVIIKRFIKLRNPSIRAIRN